ncbi:Calx-beta domain protein [Rosistilla carotiformis]|uniref:Calx-beta domain protein n=1 Tax=Rosistilla carotiformis TaxID=2528017 RepID=A0A518JT34_9BACT|nr:FG-GAP-like repeat-containing protein [Rosistilla carotiformis]QDV68703.1 Calx-beta domain protein [Rosistilla carotiformis]
MSLKNIGRFFGAGSNRNSSRKATPLAKHRRLRSLITESLEPRQLLAADLAPTTLTANHNYLVAEDVNADFRVTPNDALIVINELARRGVGELDSSTATTNRFTDVNADGSLSPLDALIVINRLNRGEAETDPLLSIELDVTQNGTSLLAEDSRNFEVEVGEKFDLEVRYTDLRSQFSNRFGVFSLYVDILATGIDSFRPVLSETQIIELSENLDDASGAFSLSFADQPQRIADVLLTSTNPDIPTLQSDPEEAIKIAIEEGLGLGEGTVSVTEAARNGRENGQVGTGESFRYIIRFVGDSAEFTNIPNLVVDTSKLTGAAVAGSLTEVPVFTSADQTQINPNSLVYNIDYRSSSLDDRVIYGDVRSGVYNPGNRETFDEVGGVGPGKTNGLYDDALTHPNLLDHFEAFSIEMQAVRPQDAVTFTLDLPDNERGSEIALYGSSATSDIALTDDMISIVLADDPATEPDDRTGLVIGRFVIPTELPIQAVQDNFPINEDAPNTRFDVLANDLPSAGELTVLSVGPAANGTTSVVQGEVFYKPNADFFGNDTFTYEISNGVDLATGTVVVEVASINDPPQAQEITITVPRGQTVAIPYTSFMLPQPANESRSFSITEVSATHGQVRNSTGNNLVYVAPTSNVANDIIDVAFTDGQQGDNSGATTINVVIINPFGPTGVPDTVTVNEDTPTTLSVAAELLNNDTITSGTKRLVGIDSSSTLGTVEVLANGTFRYTPPANQFGLAVDSFYYTMTDGTETSDPTLVSIDVVAINDPPVAGDRAVTINTATTSSLTIDVSSVISPGLGEAGVVGETVAISAFTYGNRGGLVELLPGAMGVIYTPVAGITGTETFTYTVADQLGLESTGTITVTITNNGGGGTGGTASIQGEKFHDLNDNGSRDPNEPTLPGWTIYLDLNNNGSLDTGEPTSVTDAQGEYRFENLLAANYSVREQAQTGWRQSFPRMITSQNISVETGDYVGFTTVVDFDHDGDLDIVVANEYSVSTKRESNIALLTNNGGGNFAQSTLPLPNDSRPQAVIADQDFTGDGIADLVVASAGIQGNAQGGSQANGIQLFVGTETGYNTSFQYIPAGDGPTDLASRDLNDDGIVDLLVANHRSNNVSILIGTGGGNFALPVQLETGDQPVALALQQLASDGQDLLAVANYSAGSVSIFTGDNGSFTLLDTISGLTNPTDVLLLDINADGKNDLVVADSGTNTIRTFLGDGKGDFTPFDARAVNTGANGDTRERPEALDVTDFNRDGLPDLLIANREGGESLWINNGNGTFTYATNQLLQSIPNFNPLLAKSIAVANLDGDDQLDYVVAFAAGGIAIHTTTVSADPGFYLITLADGQASVNNDFGNVELATAPTANVTMTVSQTAITENTTSNTSVVTLSLSQALATPVTVTLGLGGAATLNADYTISTAVVTIPAGATTATATITSQNDVIDEGDAEQIALTIESVVGAVENGQQQATIMVIDDDTIPLPSLVIASTPSIVTEGTAATVTATLSYAATQDVEVTLGYANGTATVSADFTGPTSLIIPAGQTSATVTLTTLQDGIDETDEAIIIDVLGVVGATELGLQSTTINLIDADAPPPSVTLSASGNSMPESGGFVTFTATLDSLSAGDVVIELAFSGTATLNADFIIPPEIRISAGNLTGTVSANAVNDLLDDEGESFNVEIFAAHGASPVEQDPLSVAIVDDDAPTVSLQTDAAVIIEDGGISRLTAVLSSPATTDTIVNLVFSGTAVMGRHYTVQSQRIVVPANSTSASILIQAINNQEIENANLIINVTALGATDATSITIRNEDGVAFPLRAAGQPATNAAAASIDESDLATIYAASLDVWQHAGLDSQSVQRLRDLAFEIADLDEDLLGLAQSDRILIDSDAAGFGWFIDATPLDDSEFASHTTSTASDAIDLLTVVLHEQGHHLGLDHGDSELMLESLSTGTRRTPSVDDVDEALRSMF